MTYFVMNKVILSNSKSEKSIENYFKKLKIVQKVTSFHFINNKINKKWFFATFFYMGMPSAVAEFSQAEFKNSVISPSPWLI